MKALIPLASLIIICAGCEKDGPELPAATHNGANTFGCKINGRVYIKTGKYSRVTSNGLSAIPSLSDYWTISAYDGDNAINMCFDYKSNPQVPGTFIMADTYPYRAYGHCPAVFVNEPFSTDSLHTGAVYLTDYTNTYASGTFAFDAITPTGAVVHVTEGRFDIEF